MKKIILKKLSNNRLELVSKYRLSGNDVLFDKLEIDLLDRYPSISTMNEESLNEFYSSLEEFYGRISKYVQYSIGDGDEESVTPKEDDPKEGEGVSDIQISDEEVDTNTETTHKHRTNKKNKIIIK